MAIIDVHYHFHPFVDEWAAPERAKDGMRKRMRSVGIEPEAQLEFLLQKMDENGVEKTGLMNPTGDKSHSMGVPNGPFAKLMNRHSDRFFGWAGLQILPKPDLDEAKRAIEEHGFTGFKFIPTSQYFYPHDFELMGEVYEYCEKVGAPIIWHMGPGAVIPTSRAIFSDIRYLNEVAYRYKGLNLIMAHCGEHDTESQAIGLASAFPNVYIEASARLTVAMCEAMPPKAGGDIFQRHKDEWLHAENPTPEMHAAWEKVREEHEALIRRIANRCPGKFMFGTDGPFAMTLDRAITEYERAFPDPAQRQEIFHDTAKKLLKL